MLDSPCTKVDSVIGRTQFSERFVRVWVCVCAMFSLLLFTGCASQPQSSRIAIVDYQVMAEQMAQSLRESDAFAQRTPMSQPWVVSFTKVMNLSSEVMTQGEQWGVVAKVRSAQPITQLWNEQRVMFVIPAQRTIDARENMDTEMVDQRFGSQRAVTHTITATFRSVTRADGMTRSDLYACTFEMIDLATGQSVWLDEFEFKRTASGSIWD